MERTTVRFRERSARIERQLNTHAKLLFRIANATDEDYQEYVGFPAAGATASVGVKLSL